MAFLFFLLERAFLSIWIFAWFADFWMLLLSDSIRGKKESICLWLKSRFRFPFFVPCFATLYLLVCSLPIVSFNGHLSSVIFLLFDVHFFLLHPLMFTRSPASVQELYSSTILINYRLFAGRVFLFKSCLTECRKERIFGQDSADCKFAASCLLASSSSMSECSLDSLLFSFSPSPFFSRPLSKRDTHRERQSAVRRRTANLGAIALVCVSAMAATHSWLLFSFSSGLWNGSLRRRHAPCSDNVCSQMANWLRVRSLSGAMIASGRHSTTSAVVVVEVVVGAIARSSLTLQLLLIWWRPNAGC